MLDPAIPPERGAAPAGLCRLELRDTAPEASVDRITRTAARLFDVPTALIMLVEGQS